MPKENLDSTLALAEAFNRRDWDAFRALTDEDVELESRLVVMEGAFHGHAGLRRWWDTFFGVFPDYSLELEETRNLGDVTLSRIRASGHGAGSETPLVDRFWMPIRWCEGRCVWWRICSTEEEALEAAGLLD